MKNATTIAVLGSHSALDVCRGAKDEGLSTLVIAQKGREKTYETYYKSKGDIGCVDECMVLGKFSDLLDKKVQNVLIEKNVVFIPHRSFQVYLNYDYNAIEKKFSVPVFGNKFLLRTEERTSNPSQYDILRKAAIKIPLHFKNPKDIDRLCIVKVSEKERAYERAFFLASSPKEYKGISGKYVRSGKITEQALERAVIEEFILGAQINFNFFYSTLSKRLELLGTDTRRQTNLDGLLRIPSPSQNHVLDSVSVTYEEAGHVAVTVIESMLEQVFALGEAFVKATQAMFPPGIIGPFALQSIITPGSPKKDIVVVDVSPRMPGSPGIASTPYSGYLFGQPVSVGKRIAMEIKEALKRQRLQEVIT